MQDIMYYGRSLRTLNVMHESNREILTMKVGLSLAADHVVRFLKQLVGIVDLTKAIRIDNESEFRAVIFAYWFEEKRH